MADKRAYFKLDVGYLANPKVATLLDDEPRAILLHLQCIAYSAQHLTDGVVPVRMAMRLACAEQCDVDLLVQCGLLDVLDERRVMVHDYLEHQRPASEVKRASEQAKRAAEARWSDAPGNADSMPDALQTAMPREKREKRESNTSSETADATKQRDDVERICSHLADRIEANGAKRPAITAKWRDAARLMLDRDERSEDDIHGAIDWCQSDEFWRGNILSLPKLREKYEQLRLQAERGNVRAIRPRTDANGNPILPPLPADDRR